MENENVLNLNIKCTISDKSYKKFEYDLHKLTKHLAPSVQYLIVKLFIQIGKGDWRGALDYKHKNDIIIYLQPKIKTYIEFKTLSNAENYIENELDDNELFLFLEVNRKDDMRGRTTLDMFDSNAGIRCEINRPSLIKALGMPVK